MKKLTMLMVLVAQTWAAENPYIVYPIVSSVIETRLVTSASSSLPSSLTTPLIPYQAVARLISATGSYSYTTSATSAEAVTLTAGTEVKLGIRDDIRAPSDFYRFKYVGDWYIRLGYR